jgi:hypothetical protein
MAEAVRWEVDVGLHPAFRSHGQRRPIGAGSTQTAFGGSHPGEAQRQVRAFYDTLIALVETAMLPHIE